MSSPPCSNTWEITKTPKNVIRAVLGTVRITRRGPDRRERPFIGVKRRWSSHLQRAHGVEDGEDGDAHVGEDGHPEGGEAEGGEQEDEHLDADGEEHVLAGDGEGAAGDADGLGDLRGLVVHQDDVGGLDGGVGAEGAHRDAEVRAGEDRGVVDAVAHEGDCAGGRFPALHYRILYLEYFLHNEHIHISLQLHHKMILSLHQFFQYTNQ